MSKPSVADQMLIDWRREVLHENRRLRAAVDKVRALHHHNPCPIAECAGHCSECAADYDKWPCPTIRALDEALDDA